jgi:hypothetical protein
MDSNLSVIVRRGWLEKEGGKNVRSWKKRWFVLDSTGKVTYWKKQTDIDPAGSFMLPSFTSVECVDHKKSKFTIKVSGSSEGKLNIREYLMVAENEEEMKGWLKCMSVYITASPSIIGDSPNTPPSPPPEDINLEANMYMNSDSLSAVVETLLSEIRLSSYEKKDDSFTPSVGIKMETLSIKIEEINSQMTKLESLNMTEMRILWDQMRMVYAMILKQ